MPLPSKVELEAQLETAEKAESQARAVRQHVASLLTEHIQVHEGEIKASVELLARVAPPAGQQGILGSSAAPMVLSIDPRVIEHVDQLVERAIYQRSALGRALRDWRFWMMAALLAVILVGMTHRS